MVTHEKFMEQLLESKRLVGDLSRGIATVWDKWTSEQQRLALFEWEGTSCVFSRRVLHQLSIEMGNWSSRQRAGLLEAAEQSVKPVPKGKVFVDEATGKRYKVIEEEA